MNNDYLPIFFSSDNNYAVPTFIALYSLARNYKGNHNIKVFILTSGDFCEGYLALFQNLTKEFEFLDVSFINMKDSYSGVVINNAHITTATMYRLVIPRVCMQMGISKCIYLDSDIIVEGDISELFSIDIGGFCIGGVSNIPAPLSVDEKRDGCRGSALQQEVNAGVLVFNVSEIIERGLDKKLENLGYLSFPDNDQDVINSVFSNTIKLIPNRFNKRRIHFKD